MHKQKGAGRFDPLTCRPFSKNAKTRGGEFLHSLNSSEKTTLWTNPGEKQPSAKPTDWGGKMTLGSKMLKNQGGDF
jgi:hypothetical protein